MKKVLTTLGVLFIIFVGGCTAILMSIGEDLDTETVTTNHDTTETKKDTETKVTKKKEDKSKLTLEKFNKIKTNMTYDEVVKILGVEGEVMSESEVAGIKTVLYTWDGSFGANMNATFQNDKLISKAQLGLE